MGDCGGPSVVKTVIIVVYGMVDVVNLGTGEGGNCVMCGMMCVVGR